ncbi:alpha/beta hydrolase [Aeromicrobium alkaliterrae]|uniref:Alpha/beta hydrolase n=1 Tax=Aeromicrobium alkaliterrae TaxID=302168 RepID=A0ABP4WC11_9ACTN
MSTATTVVVAVQGDTIDARHHRAEIDDLRNASGVPCVVMAHGIGATQDSGLEGFAQVLAAGGLDVVTFDYRHFAASSGEPRQLVSPRLQVDDYLAVVRHARTLEGVDPDRIVVWGVSFSGGHVLRVSAQDSRIAGVVALTPAVDGAAVVASMLRTQPGSYFTRLIALAVRDAVAGWRGRVPVMAPIVAEVGEPAALNSAGAVEGMLATAGPTWRNEFAARLFLTVAAYRPITSARHIQCPVLVQIGDRDRSAPPAPAARAAIVSGATVHHYPCDHFDVYPGAAWHERVVRDQVRFLRRTLAV